MGQPAAPNPRGRADLRGEVAIVTGASSGFGAAIAEGLAAEGCRLVLGARRVARLERLAAGLRERHGLEVAALELDVLDLVSVERFARQAIAASGSGGPQLLVNNAGLALGTARIPSAGPDDEADWATMLNTNVLGLLAVTRRIVPALVARGRGQVINLGSLAGIETYEGGSVYCASKAAVRIISRALRYELLGTGVRVGCVNPGMAETEFSNVRLRDDAAAKAVYRGMTPLDAEDVARAVVWMATQPEAMNIEELWIQPTDQASAQRVHRRPG